jgi:hypothetical protein
MPDEFPEARFVPAKNNCFCDERIQNAPTDILEARFVPAKTIVFTATVSRLLRTTFSKEDSFRQLRLHGPQGTGHLPERIPRVLLLIGGFFIIIY